MSTVAVVLCNYNHAKYLPDSLGHICAQTRPADQIVVIDDGSTDHSWDIIQKFARECPNLEAHANARNAGLEASIARALPLVRCDYLVWAAADDRLLPPFLERNMAVLARHPVAALSFSEVVSLKGDSEEIDRFATNPAAPRIFDLSDLPEYLSPDQLRNRMKRGYLPIASNTAVIRVHALTGFGGFPSAPETDSCGQTQPRPRRPATGSPPFRRAKTILSTRNIRTRSPNIRANRQRFIGTGCTGCRSTRFARVRMFLQERLAHAFVLVV